MNPEPEKPRNEATTRARRAEWRAVLDALDANGPSPLAPPSEAVVNEMLRRWDELAPADLERLRRHPVQGQRLQHLLQAEAWLREGSPASDRCPGAEELYDHGRGPGARALTPERADEIERHLAESRSLGCCGCAEHVASLTAAPPPPVQLDTPPDLGPTASRGPRRTRWLQGQWWPAAAAAAAVAVFALWAQRPRALDAGAGFPTNPLLRGAADEALSFPRANVLAGGTPPVARDLMFELTPTTNAVRYRIVVRRHDGGAFASGEQVLVLDADGPTLTPRAVFVPGHYTWEAWVTIDGLEQLLGERDFEVIDDARLRTRLAAQRPLEQVRILHAEAFYADARRVARSLPASEARDAYLAARPGR